MKPKERSALYKKLNKKIFDDLMRACGTDVDNFSPDPHWNAYNMGKRAIGLYVKRWREMSEKKLEQME